LSVFENLREGIISLELKPGTILSRLELQQRYNLSSSPIRDALMRLQAEHLVDVFPQHATVVSVINLDHAKQAQFMRKALEIEIVKRLVSECSKEVIEALLLEIKRQKAFFSIDDYHSFMLSDHNFHRMMFEAAYVPELWELMRQQSGHIDRLRRLHLPISGKMASIIQDHEAIISAIIEKNLIKAEDTVRGHLSRSLDFSDKLKEKYPEYF
jgi:GntR family transcriptional regulator, rspAB operon transcriptional repressor